MFLALREIRHQPRRFALITAVIALVAFVAFFLSSLSFGLAHAFSAAFDKFDDADVVLSSSANNSISASRLTADEVTAGTKAGGNALLVVGSVAENDGAGSGAKTDVFGFGMDSGTALWPTVTEGTTITDASAQVIADDSLARSGWKVGDTLKLGSSGHEWKIVGFTHDSTYITAPVLYMDRAALKEDGPVPGTADANAIIATTGSGGAVVSAIGDGNVTSLDAQSFIGNIAGYSAQVDTFNMMIAALIGITALVLAIFIYVITLQKRDVLGVLKAQGVPTGQLVESGVLQTVLLAVVGIVVGATLTGLTMLVLPASMPFRLDWPLDALIVGAFILFAALGGLIAVRSVARIDPVEAIA